MKLKIKNKKNEWEVMEVQFIGFMWGVLLSRIVLLFIGLCIIILSSMLSPVIKSALLT